MIRVGHALGEKDELGAIERSKVGILVVALISISFQ